MAREAEGGPGLLARAIELAARAHVGQVDLAGAPYILHPLRVMGAIRSAGYCEEMQVAAVLHDVVEDTAYDLGVIRAAFGSEVAGMVDALSRRKNPDGSKEPRGDYLGRVIDAGPRALAIKFADLRDHLEYGGAEFLKVNHPELLERYVAELTRIDRAWGAPVPQLTRAIQ